MIKNLKNNINKIKNKIVKNYTDIIFITGMTLIYIALYKIHVNLGLICTGISFIYFSLMLHWGNKKKETKRTKVDD